MSQPNSDPIEQALGQAAQQGQNPELDFENLPAPRTDEIDLALSTAATQGQNPDLAFDQLPAPNTIPNAEPQTSPPQPDTEADEVTRALNQATAQGATADLPFDALPAPQPTSAQTAPSFSIQTTASDFWLALPLFVAFRLLTLALLRPGGFIRDWSDFDTYLGIAALSDYQMYPYLDFWLEWPPLLPWLSVGVYQLSLFFPPWSEDHRLWFILLLGTIFVLFEVGNFALIHQLSRRLTADVALRNRMLWIYAALFTPLYTMLGFFDGISLFFLLLALLWLIDERPILSGIAVGVGFMVKLIPLIVVGVAVRTLWYRYREDREQGMVEIALYGLVVCATIFTLIGPFLFLGTEWVRASVLSMVSRAPWETVWAVLDGYYGFGVVRGDRLNPAETDFATHVSTLPWSTITLIFGLIYLWFLSRPANYAQPRSLIAFTGLTLSGLMLYSKGFSPQFLVYLLPFIVLIYPNGRGIVYALILTALNVLEQPIYFVLLPDSDWLLVAIVFSRYLVMIFLALEFLTALWPSWAETETMRPFYARLPQALVGASLLAGLFLLPLTWQAYAHQRLNDSPVEPLIRFMQAQIEPNAPPPRLLVSDQPTYRQLYPFLQGQVELRLAGGDTNYTAAPSVDELVAGAETVWLLPVGEAQQVVQQRLSQRSQLIADYQFAPTTGALLHYNVSGQRQSRPFAEARFTNGIQLIEHDVLVEADGIEIILFWRATSVQNRSYTVFTQLLSPDGQLIASHDGIPSAGLAPTNSWQPDRVYLDRHRISLISELSAGDYTIIAGLYDETGQRLGVVDPSGARYPNQAIPLERVRLE